MKKRISHLCAKTPVFLHSFGDPPETFKNQYKSTLGAFHRNCDTFVNLDKKVETPMQKLIGSWHQGESWGTLRPPKTPIHPKYISPDLWWTPRPPKSKTGSICKLQGSDLTLFIPILYAYVNGNAPKVDLHLFLQVSGGSPKVCKNKRVLAHKCEMPMFL